jgi:hypothetical protein
MSLYPQPEVSLGEFALVDFALNIIYVTHTSESILIGDGAAVDGVSKSNITHTSQSVLSAPGAGVDGFGLLNWQDAHPLPELSLGEFSLIEFSTGVVTHGTSAALSGTGGHVAAVAEYYRRHDTISLLTAAGALIDSRAHSNSNAMGDLAGGSAQIEANAIRKTPGILEPATIAAIADAVWAHSSAIQIEQRMLEAWGRLGLDPSKPVTQGDTEISFGAITLALAIDSTGTGTITRS